MNTKDRQQLYRLSQLLHEPETTNSADIKSLILELEGLRQRSRAAKRVLVLMATSNHIDALPGEIDDALTDLAEIDKEFERIGQQTCSFASASAAI